jgi:hypothetical protein
VSTSAGLPSTRQLTFTKDKNEGPARWDYFTKGYNDIMADVDYLIKEGIVDVDHMGALGWSAGAFENPQRRSARLPFI